MSTCNDCDGLEVVERDGKLHECLCSFLKRISASMPPYIRKADVQRSHLDLPIMGAVGNSVYVTASWADMKAIIKAAMLKNPKKLIRITSDAEIRDVFVGSKSKSARTDDFDGETFNNLQDLMDPPDLMVVRLNELAYKNKAAAGALEEALSYRLDRDKPTWVFSNLDRRFSVGSFSYSDSVAELLGSGYRRMNIERILKLPDAEGLFADPVEVPGHHMIDDSGPPPARKERRPREPAEPAEADGPPERGNPLDRYGSGLGNKRTGGRTR